MSSDPTISRLQTSSPGLLKAQTASSMDEGLTATVCPCRALVSTQRRAIYTVTRQQSPRAL